jgi:flagellar motor switch protein FliN/FliY
MTDDSNNNPMNTAEPAAENDQEAVNNSPAEEVQASTPNLIDFAAPSDELNLANGTVDSATPKENIDMLMDVNLQFTVELGRTQMPVRQILELQNGSVVELDRIAGEAVDVFINEHLMARGEVVVVDDKFGVRITELISPTKGK